MANSINNESICRLCLKRNIRMYSIKNTYLQDVYEKITSIELSSNYIQSLCYLCVQRLKHCHKLIGQAISTDKLLKDALKCGVEISSIECTQTFKLSVSSTINISLDPIEVEIKEENTKIKEETEDNEDNGQNYDISSQMDEDQNDQNIAMDSKETCSLDGVKSEEDMKDLSDSEDDMPLKKLISLKLPSERKDITVKNKKLKKFNKDTKVDAQEIILDEEQQLVEMLQRSKSLNYLNSPFKCDLCYKGFLDPTAFEKHKEKHDEISGPHECKLCHLRYLTVKSLRAHTSSAHSRRYSCNICSHRSHTNKPTSYLSHVRAWHAGDHVCSVCGESFARKHGLLMHVSKTHRTRSDKPKSEPAPDGFCSECNIQFSSSEAKTRHILISKRHAIFKDNDEVCSLCGAKVPPASRAAHARRHVRALAPPRPARPALLLACAQCEATFPSRTKLQNHVKRIHLGLKYNKNVVCEICGKKCTSNATLRYHQRRHTGEKPYPCEKCPSKFISREQLRIHSRTHSGERPYSCALCGNRFSQKPALNRHYRVHTGAKPYECHVCNKPFSQSNSLKTHIRTVHLRLPPNKKKKNNPDGDKVNTEIL